MIKIFAPAKINLTLEVLSLRADGYHEISSVMQTVGLCDELTFGPAGDITLDVQGLDLPAEDNLVMKAARALREKSTKPVGAAISLKKAIPTGGGLGGGSSDAAAALLALNRLWQLGLSTEQLVELAARLGSDVPFFIYGGTALVGGRGERVTPLGKVEPVWIVLLLPLIVQPAGKTRRMYEILTPGDFTDGDYGVRMVKQIREKGRISKDLLFNVFERTAPILFPDLKIFRAAMQDAGSGRVGLAGSGPVLYTIFLRQTDAAELCGKLASGGNRVYVVKTLDRDERYC